MKIGFMTNILFKHGMKTLGQVAQWGMQNGFTDLEVGPAVPLDEAVFRDMIQKNEISLTTLTYCRNFLSTDKDEVSLHIEELKSRIIFAGKLGIKKVVTSTGIDKRVEEGVYDKADSIRKIPIRSLDLIEKIFAPLVKIAEDTGVKICFENCPLMGNAAISPYMWQKIFERIDSPNVGLAFDPSHLIWQFIDPYKAAADFGDKIFHVHAKDTQVDKDLLSRVGILTDFSWWRYRIPGGGEIDWERLMNILKSNGYAGTISLEHEDPLYEDGLEKVKEGIIKGKEFLLHLL